jgi:16S rRNA (uracil1498-N3)-methyltransferase
VRLLTVGDTATGAVVGPAAAAAESPLAVTLVQAVPKGERMETVVRAATELGVMRILPALTERTVVRLEGARAGDRARRWQRVAREAAKQCGRAVVPVVEAPRPLAEWIAGETADLRLCFWEVEGAPLRRVIEAHAGPARSACAIVGPEGGLTEAEVADARAAGYATVTLGPRVLRTDTAGVAIVALLQYAAGDLGGEAR